MSYCSCFAHPLLAAFAACDQPVRGTTPPALPRPNKCAQARLHHVVSQLLLSQPPSHVALPRLADAALDDAFAASASDEDYSPGRGASAGSSGRGSPSAASGRSGLAGSGRLKGGRPSSRPLLAKAGRGGDEAGELQHRLLTITAQTEGEGGSAAQEAALPAPQPLPAPPPGGASSFGPPL